MAWLAMPGVAFFGTLLFGGFPTSCQGRCSQVAFTEGTDFHLTGGGAKPKTERCHAPLAFPKGPNSQVHIFRFGCHQVSVLGQSLDQSPSYRRCLSFIPSLRSKYCTFSGSVLLHPPNLHNITVSRSSPYLRRYEDGFFRAWVPLVSLDPFRRPPQNVPTM